MDQRGVTAMTFAIVSFVLLGMTGLATEAGSWYLARGSAQAAADGAAVAAALALNAGSDPNAAALTAADSAVRNGFTNGGTVSVTVNIPPATGPFAGDALKAETIVTLRLPPLLARLFLGDDITINAGAVAALLPISTACVLSTSTTSNGGDLVVNAPQFANGCSYASNANGATAINIYGVNPSDVNVYAFSTSGDCSGCPPVNPAFFSRPNASFQPPVKDPYKASLGSVGGLLPGAHTCVDPATMRDAITGIYYLVPARPVGWAGGAENVYCADVVIPANATAVVTPGVYFFKDAALTIQDGASLQCRWFKASTTTCDFAAGGTPTGVTLVFAGNPATTPNLKITSTAKVQLSAPRLNDGQTGQNYIPSLLGVLFVRDGGMPSGAIDAPVVEILATPANPAGGSGAAPTYTVLNGLLYFPNAYVKYGANGVIAGGVPQSPCTTLVAGAVKLADQSSTFQDCAGAGYLPVVPKVLAGRIVQ